jgi:hypothetical protein
MWRLKKVDFWWIGVEYVQPLFYTLLLLFVALAHPAGLLFALFYSPHIYCMYKEVTDKIRKIKP